MLAVEVIAVIIGEVEDVVPATVADMPPRKACCPVQNGVIA
jgi:hypothetical protein